MAFTQDGSLFSFFCRLHLVQGLAKLLPRLVEVLLQGVGLEHEVIPLVLMCKDERQRFKGKGKDWRGIARR